MAFNLLSGGTDERSWARGDVVLDAAVARAKRLPWMKIFAGACIAVGGILILSPDKKSSHGRRRADDEPSWMNETREIPRESMRKLVLEDPEHKYGRSR
jgi:hypothetical protein